MIGQVKGSAALIITSTRQITVNIRQTLQGAISCASALVLPRASLGREHRIVTPAEGRVLITAAGTGLVSVTVPSTLTNARMRYPGGEARAGQTVAISLSQYSTILLDTGIQSGGDFTGLLIKSDTPLSVWIVHSTFNAQMPPIEFFAREYILFPAKIVAHYPNTVVRVGSNTYNLQPGQFQEFNPSEVTAETAVSSNLPIIVGTAGQTTTGSLAISPGIPLVQAKASYIFDTVGTGTKYLILYARTNQRGNVALNGQRLKATWREVPNKPDWSAAIIFITNPGVYRLYHSVQNELLVAYLAAADSTCTSMRPIGYCFKKVNMIHTTFKIIKKYLPNFVLILKCSKI